MCPLAGTTPYAREPLVELEHPYSQVVHDAIQTALNRVLDMAIQMLILSTYSPIPKDTGFLRSQTRIDIRPSAEGLSFLIYWPNVPYAQYLIEHAHEWQFRHAADPMAVGDFPEPAMRMVFPLVLSAIQQELASRGIQFTVTSGF